MRIPHISYKVQLYCHEVLQLIPLLCPKIFLKVSDTLLIGDIFVMIANLSLCGRSIDRLRKLVRFFQSFR